MKKRNILTLFAFLFLVSLIGVHAEKTYTATSTYYTPSYGSSTETMAFGWKVMTSSAFNTSITGASKTPLSGATELFIYEKGNSSLLARATFISNVATLTSNLYLKPDAIYLILAGVNGSTFTDKRATLYYPKNSSILTLLNGTMCGTNGGDCSGESDNNAIIFDIDRVFLNYSLNSSWKGIYEENITYPYSGTLSQHSFSDIEGFTYLVKGNVSITNITKYAPCTAGMAYIMNDTSIIANATFVNNKASFSPAVNLQDGSTIHFGVNNTIGTFEHFYTTEFTGYPVYGSYLDWQSCYSNGVSCSNSFIHNIQSITINVSQTGGNQPSNTCTIPQSGNWEINASLSCVFSGVNINLQNVSYFNDGNITFDSSNVNITDFILNTSFPVSHVDIIFRNYTNVTVKA